MTSICLSSPVSVGPRPSFECVLVFGSLSPACQPSCSYCSPGRFSKDGVTCFHCPPGTVTYGERTIDTWTYLPEGFSSSCNGECDANGWLVSGDTLRTGYSTGSYDSQLVMDTITVTHPTAGYIAFECAVDCSLVPNTAQASARSALHLGGDKVSFSDHCHLDFYIQDVNGLRSFPCASPDKRDGTRIKHLYNLTSGEYRFL